MSSHSSGSKLKILLFGEIGGGSRKEEDAAKATVDAFVSKLKTLHQSKAGPFHAAFCFIGSSSSSSSSSSASNIISNDLIGRELPVPVYLHGFDNIQKEEEHHQKDDKDVNDNEDDGKNNKKADDGDGEVIRLGNNLYLLNENSRNKKCGAGTGIWSLNIAPPKHPELVVAACPSGYRSDDSDSLMSKLSHVSYIGCDLLLSFEPPQGASQLLANVDPMRESWDVAHAALHARARYHFFSPNPIYEQSKPYEHLGSTTNTAEIRHVGRLIALAPFADSSSTSGSTPMSKKDKKRFKSVHALSLTPLHSMSSAELTQQRPSHLNPCPFTDASYPVEEGKESTNNLGSNSIPIDAGVAGLSQASARRILQEEQERGSDQHRWAFKKKRPRPDNNTGSTGRAATTAGSADCDDPAHATSTTLFVYGLHQSEELQSSHGKVLLLQAMPGATRVRQSPSQKSNSFAFVEFASHEQAALVLQNTRGELSINGVDLTVKWASENTNRGSNKRMRDDDSLSHQQQGRPVRLTEEQAKDSCSVYFKWVVRDTATGKNARSDNETPPPAANDEQDAVLAESLRRWVESTLEDALNEGNDDDRVMAKDEPALRVQLRLRKGFGFLEFASHAAASMALATLTGNTDGGAVLAEANRRPSELWDKLFLNWAQLQEHDDPNKQKKNDVIEDAAGTFSFSRPHFAPDTRTDCWFCLASPTCEKHLLTGVFEQCYAAMPKGPVHPGHVLLVPISHNSQGAFIDPGTESEVQELMEQLRKHAAATYDCDLFVFERAIVTKGGYHAHVQCIPVKRQLGLKLQSTLLRQSAKSGFDLREVSSDVALSSILKNHNDNNDDENCEEKGYFYAEIPVSGLKYKRFLYKQSSKPTGRVPLQFGREVLAAVLERPDLAHWKSCVVEKDQEASLASACRESFAKFESSSTE